MTDSPVTAATIFQYAGLAVNQDQMKWRLLSYYYKSLQKLLELSKGSIEVGKDADIVIFDGNPIKR